MRYRKRSYGKRRSTRGRRRRGSTRRRRTVRPLRIGYRF